VKLRVNKPREMQFIGRQIERDIRNLLTVRVVTALREFHRAIQDTPVYTGRTLVNYRWSIGSPVEGRRAAIANPRLPGKTSTLGVGYEPRRAANQAIIDAEFEGLVNSLMRSKNPFQRIYLRNNMPNFDEIEYGTYSQGSRTPPGGMVRRGEAILEVIIKGVTKVG
jgi:hypothetical protein